MFTCCFSWSFTQQGCQRQINDLIYRHWPIGFAEIPNIYDFVCFTFKVKKGEKIVQRYERPRKQRHLPAWVNHFSLFLRNACVARAFKITNLSSFSQPSLFIFCHPNIDLVRISLIAFPRFYRPKSASISNQMIKSGLLSIEYWCATNRPTHTHATAVQHPKFCLFH